MSDHIQTGVSDERPYDIVLEVPLLPPFLVRGLLHPDERTIWVRGPKSTWWESWATHPLLFVVALLIGSGCLTVGRISSGSWGEMEPAPFVAAIGLFFGSIFVLGFASGHFTRLIVTDRRMLIVQGRETCRAWDIDDLPDSLVRFDRRPGIARGRSIDIEAVKTLLNSSDKVSESKTITAFGKNLDRITSREGRPPSAG